MLAPPPRLLPMPNFQGLWSSPMLTSDRIYFDQKCTLLHFMTHWYYFKIKKINWRGIGNDSNLNRRDFYVKELIPLSEGGLFEPLNFTLKFQQTPAQIQLLTCSVALLSAGLCEQYAVATDHRGRNWSPYSAATKLLYHWAACLSKPTQSRVTQMLPAIGLPGLPTKDS